MRKIQFQNGYRSDSGFALWVVLILIIIGTVVALTSLFMSTERIKNSSDYAACQRALDNADAGVDRVVHELINTPDTNGDGIYSDAPPSTSDTWGTKIYDIDNNGINDFNQLFAKNKNIPDVTGVSESNALGLFITSGDEAYVWIQSNTPNPYYATIHSRSTSGGCTKKVKVVVKAVAGSPGSGITSPIYNAPPT